MNGGTRNSAANTARAMPPARHRRDAFEERLLADQPGALPQRVCRRSLSSSALTRREFRLKPPKSADSRPRMCRIFVGRTGEINPSHWPYWRPQGDSNPCYRRERAMSWASRRWGLGPCEPADIIPSPLDCNRADHNPGFQLLGRKRRSMAAGSKRSRAARALPIWPPMRSTSAIRRSRKAEVA